MTNRMLINATQAEEVRVAIVNGSVLDNLDTEIQGKEQQKANIYKGKITRIEPSLEAVFVDYGSERHGFLPFREISRIYQKDQDAEQGEASETEAGGEGSGEEDRNKRRAPMRERFTEGQELIIQVEKEARGNKGAALTTYVSLAGCYLVLMPLNPTAGGISRRIENEERAELREVLNQLSIPEGMGVIVRTAGVGRDIKDLQWDLDFLVQQWHAIEGASRERPAPFLIYQESNVVVRAIRDHLRPEINEILVDSPIVYEDVLTYIRMMRPDYINRVRLYNDSIPLFSRFQIESQIEDAMQREVRLPSGGSVVIDHTEALISIDINSAKATKGGDIEETALQTNLEAAEAIARQLRLRDIGGLIVIDFIDMNSSRNQRAVEQKLKEAMEVDRARVQIGKISSRFGLLEMSRQRLRPSLASTRDIVCPRCLGQGTIRGVEVLAINIIRLIEEEAIKEGTTQVLVEVPNEVTTYLINEKRQAVLEIERKHHIRVIIVPSQHLETPNFIITRSKKEEGEEEAASYTLGTKPEIPKNVYNTPSTMQRPAAAAVSNINPSMAPQRKSIFKRLITSLLGDEEQPKVSEHVRTTHTHHAQTHAGSANGGQRSQGNLNKSRNRRHRPQRPRSDERGGERTTNRNNDRGGVRTERGDNRVERERGEGHVERNETRVERSSEQRSNYQPRYVQAAAEHAPREREETREMQYQEPKMTYTAEVTEIPFTRTEPELPDQPFVQNVEITDIDSAKHSTTQNQNRNQQRRRKPNRRRNHYRKGQGNQGNKVQREESAPSETKVDD